jgi:hypothetical protein
MKQLECLPARHEDDPMVSVLGDSCSAPQNLVSNSHNRDASQAPSHGTKMLWFACHHHGGGSMK